MPDLNLDYPFLEGDSWDWIASGLRFAGADVRYSGRPPLLPAVIAVLDRLAALRWLPVLLQVLFLATVLAFYGLAARLGPRRAAFATALALLFGHSIQGLALQVGADVPASCLLFFAVRSFLLAGEGAPRRYLASGIWGAAGALTQPAALLAVVPAGLMVLGWRRPDLRSPWLAAGAGVFVGVPLTLLWLVRRLALPGDPLLLRERLLHPHLGSNLFYAWSFASLLGLPGALLLAAGLVIALRVARRDAARLFLVLLFAVLLAFFAFFFDFNAERFLALLVWPAGLLIAEALARLPPGLPFRSAAALLVIGSALPLPRLGNDPSYVGLWPLPPVYASLRLTGGDAAGSPRLDPRSLSVQALSMADLVRFSVPARVWEERAEVPAGRLAPEEVAADRGALFLAAGPADGGGRYRTLTRLGNVLRKRVKFIPAAQILPWLPRLAVTPVGTLAPDYAVFRARPPGLQDTWLLVTSAAGPVRQSLDGVAVVPAPFGRRLQNGLARARAVRRLTAGERYVIFFAGERGDPLDLYLPFVLDTTELYVVEPGDAPAVHRLLDAAPRLGEERIGRTVVRRTVYLDEPAAVITGTAAPRR